jgi:hypothetical protein
MAGQSSHEVLEAGGRGIRREVDEFCPVRIVLVLPASPKVVFKPKTQITAFRWKR